MNESKVTEAIEYACPKWKVETVRYLDEGDSCWAFVVNDDWIFRFAKNRDAGRRLAREYCVLPTLAKQLGLRIPSPQLMGQDKNGAPLFSAYPIMPGSPFSGAIYFGLDPARRRRCAKQIDTFVTQLHSIDVLPARACGVTGLDFPELFANLLRRARTGLFPFLTQEDQLFIERVCKSYAEECRLKTFQPSLLHGDLSSEHLICDGESGEITGIIDFGDMTIGDPAWDFVYLYRDLGLDLISCLLERFTGKDRISLINRISYLEVFAALDLATDCEKRSRDEFGIAIESLRNLRMSSELRRSKLV